jgi:hypothetical protein
MCFFDISCTRRVRCYSDIQRGCHEAQARRVLESSPGTRRQFSAENGVPAMDHPSYSPDLAPADFWLFPKLKRVLKGKRFSDVEVIKLSIKMLTGIPDFKNCFEQWPKLWERYKELEGDYVKNSCLLISEALFLSVWGGPESLGIFVSSS